MLEIEVVPKPSDYRGAMSDLTYGRFFAVSLEFAILVFGAVLSAGLGQWVGAIVLLVVAIVRWGREAIPMGRAYRKIPESALAPIKYRLGEEGIEVTTLQGARFVNWQSFDHVRRTKHAWYFGGPALYPLYIFRRTLTSEQDESIYRLSNERVDNVVVGDSAGKSAARPQARETS